MYTNPFLLNRSHKKVYCGCYNTYQKSRDIEMYIFMFQHLKGSPLCGGDFEEMTCQGCMTKHDFLGAYAVHSVGK